MPTTAYPGASPTTSGTTLTVDQLVRSPRLVERQIRNMSLQKFMVDLIFAPGGDVSGGAVQYQKAAANDLYAARDVQRIAPGAEHPMISFTEPGSNTAEVEKYGGKFFVTEEAITRNTLGWVNKNMQQLANTMRRKTQQRALRELDAAITLHARATAGVSWTTATTTASGTLTPAAAPASDFAAVQTQAEIDELGYEYDLMIANPLQWEALVTMYGPGNIDEVLRGFGITNRWITNQQTAGRVKFVAQRQVGEIAYERNFITTTKESFDPEGVWVKSNVKPVMYVTDPFAILELTGV